MSRPTVSVPPAGAHQRPVLRPEAVPGAVWAQQRIPIWTAIVTRKLPQNYATFCDSPSQFRGRAPGGQPGGSRFRPGGSRPCVEGQGWGWGVHTIYEVCHCSPTLLQASVYVQGGPPCHNKPGPFIFVTFYLCNLLSFAPRFRIPALPISTTLSAVCVMA